MADRAYSPFTNSPDETDEPNDLVVRASTRSPQSHQSRSRRHAEEASDWLEAEQVLKRKTRSADSTD